MAEPAIALHEADLFATAERMLVEVLGRIRPADHDLLLPPIADLADPTTDTRLWTLVEHFVADEAGVPGVLAGAGPAEPTDTDAAARWTRELAGADPQAVVVRVVDAAVAAASAVTDGATPVHAPYGTTSAARHLLRLAVTRSLFAHYVAAYLGSTACPLPEDLARQLLVATAADAETWRAAGIFRDPLPVPALASWRDTFLLTAGHLPHPLGH